MAKPKNPRLGSKPKHWTKYMAEIIDRGDNKEIITYMHFDNHKLAMDWWKGPQGMGLLVRLFRVEQRLVKEHQF